MAQTPIGRMSGEERVAILVVLLGHEASRALLGHLSQRDVARIARRVAELGPVDPGLAQQVLESYCLAALDAPRDQGGPDVARRILSEASISEELVDQLIQGHSQGREDLGPLLEAPAETLAGALQNEHPQTTALVLLHLPERRAAELLEALPEVIRAETVLRMSSVKSLRSEVLDQVAASLRERLGTYKRAGKARGGIERTAGVLSSMPRTESKRLLDELEPEHEEQVRALRDRLYTFESLIDADDRGLQQLLREVDSTSLAIALYGADEALKQRIFDNLSERAAGRLEEEISTQSAPVATEQLLMRKEIVNVALKLETDGTLSFDGPAA